MATSFEFATAGRIVFGTGKLAELGHLARGPGRRALVVTGASGRHLDRIRAELSGVGIETEHALAAGEPTVEDASRETNRARQSGCDMVVACGGGAAIDLGKAIAALAANPGEATDYLEIIGRNLPLRSASLPLIAIPTTAGTGAEATRNAVLKSRQHKVKVSLRDPRMLPAAALVDPELTLNLSPELTAATGMDALTQVLEPFVSPRSNPITDGFCREGLNRCAWALRRAYNNGQDLDAREAMCVASLMGGLALANAGLGAVHGFASPIGGMFEAPHGAVCAALLAPVWDVNTRALQQREPGCKTLERYLEAARILTGRPGASIEHGSKWLTDLARHLQIPGLRVWGIGEMDVAVIAAKSARASSMKANPIELTTAELEETLRSAL